MVAPQDASKPSWRLRRRAVFGTLVFAAFIILYVVIRWDDTQLAQTLVLSMAGLMGSIVAAYTGFAVWEDRGLYGQQNQQGYSEFSSHQHPMQHPNNYAANSNVNKQTFHNSGFSPEYDMNEDQEYPA